MSKKLDTGVCGTPYVIKTYFSVQKKSAKIALFLLIFIRNRSYQDLDQRGDFRLMHRFFPYLKLKQKDFRTKSYL